MKESAPSFRALNGSYDVELIIGDSFIDNSVVFKAASLDIKFSGDLSTPEPEIPWKPKKEIVWTQRPPEPRPPKTISLAFSALVAVPFAFLLIGVSIPSAFFFYQKLKMITTHSFFWISFWFMEPISAISLLA